MYRETEILTTPVDNFAIAKFSSWHPNGVKPKGVIVLSPPSNGDGRGDVLDPLWQRLAKRHDFALVGIQLVDRAPGWVEQYIQCSAGSGAAFLKALDNLGLSNLPLYLWGFSAGGEFNYELTCWLAPQKPGLIKAFVVNKGGVYYTLLAPEAARATPGMIFIGNRDDLWRQKVLYGIYALNHLAGCQWSQHVEAASHAYGASQFMAIEFFERIINAQAV